MLRKIFAFIKRDFLVEKSYKLSFFLLVLGILASIAVFFFIDLLFGEKIVPHLAEYGVSYFSYVIIGLALLNFVGVGMGSVSSSIREEQLMGTLEAILLTPTRLFSFVLAMVIWNTILASIELIIYLGLGVWVFSIDLSQINILSALTTMFLTIISFGSLGIISAGFIMVFKKGDPVSWLINTFAGVLGGVYFPVEILPEWLRFFSYFLPITYAVRMMELAVHKGYSLWMLRAEASILGLLTLILIFFACISFKMAVRRVRVDGSLVQY